MHPLMVLNAMAVLRGLVPAPITRVSLHASERSAGVDADARLAVPGTFMRTVEGVIVDRRAEYRRARQRYVVQRNRCCTKGISVDAARLGKRISEGLQVLDQLRALRPKPRRVALVRNH